MDIYDRFQKAGAGESPATWIGADQAKLVRCACTHKSYVKALAECGLRQCAFNPVIIQQAVIFGYQLCSKRGLIEFPYTDSIPPLPLPPAPPWRYGSLTDTTVLVSRLSITVPGNVTLPDRITIAAAGVGGAPSFPVLDEDAEKMTFTNQAWRVGPEMYTFVLAALVALTVMLGR